MFQSSMGWTRWVLPAVAGAVLTAPCGAAAERQQEDTSKIVLDDDREPRLRFVGRYGDAFDLALSAGGFLGVELVALTPELRAHFEAPTEAGVMVGRVVDDSPAWRAGLRVGDIVTSVAGSTIETPSDLAREVGARGGENVVVELWREGVLEQIDVAIEERETAWNALGEESDGDFHRLMRRYGVSCEDEDCKVLVRCDGEAGCECEVNGESRDCGEESRAGE